MQLRRLLWLDFLGGLTACVGLTLLKGWAAPLLGLPLEVLGRLASIAGVYASYSLYLTQLPRLRRPWVKALSITNASYGIYCLRLLIGHGAQASWLGCAYLMVDFSIVIALAVAEWRIVHSPATTFDDTSTTIS